MARTRGRFRAVEPEEEFDGEEEQEAPSSRRQRRNVEEFVEGRKDAGRRNRGVTREDDEEDTSSALSDRVGSGWGAVKRFKSSGFADLFNVANEGEEYLIKFVEDAPFVSYSEHFFRDLPKGTKKDYVCLGKGCPLCDMLGDKPAQRAGFNILDYTDPANPELKVWKTTPGPLQVIEDIAEGRKTSPINKEGLYFLVSKKKRAKSNFFDYKLEAIDEDELSEFGVNVNTSNEAIDNALDNLYDKSVVKITSRNDLKDLAEEILENE